MDYNYPVIIGVLIFAYSIFGLAFLFKWLNFESWVIRKYLHVAGLTVTAVIGAYAPDLDELLVTAGILVLSAILFSLRPNGFVQQVVKMASRSEESKRIALLNGIITNLTVAIMVIVWFDNKWIFFASVLCVAIGDGLGEFIGRPFGKHKYQIIHIKSVEGSIAVFIGSIISGIVAVLLLYHISLGVLTAIMLASILVTLIESVSIYFMDNVLMQVVYSIVLWLLII